MFSSQTALMHLLLKDFIHSNDICIDATCGNGFDTLFLAELIKDGKLYAIDIQDVALRRTADKLMQKNLQHRVELIHDSHESFPKSIKENSVKAIVYNLGYLPGSDKKVVTNKETTLKSLQNALPLLKREGAIFLMLYTGHPQGAEEADHVLVWAKNLPGNQYQVLRMHLVNKNLAPELIVIQGIQPPADNN